MNFCMAIHFLLHYLIYLISQHLVVIVKDLQVEMIIYSHIKITNLNKIY